MDWKMDDDDEIWGTQESGPQIPFPRPKEKNIAKNCTNGSGMMDENSINDRIKIRLKIKNKKSEQIFYYPCALRSCNKIIDLSTKNQGHGESICGPGQQLITFGSQLLSKTFDILLLLSTGF